MQHITKLILYKGRSIAVYYGVSAPRGPIWGPQYRDETRSHGFLVLLYFVRICSIDVHMLSPAQH